MLGLAVAPAAQTEWVGEARPMMGTEVSVTLYSDDADLAEVTIEAVFAEAARIDRMMSTYKDDSAISAINRQAGERWVETTDELADLIVRSVRISRLTDGAFDITYDSVGRHYDFRAGQRPDADTIETELPRIDYRHIEIDATREPPAVHFAMPGVRINLGGIAKGYVVERGAAVLREHGIRHGVVTAGGDSRLVGDRRGQPWLIGIRDPRVDDAVAMRLPLTDEAISTSGDYERFFLEGGVRYHHIIRPATGEPADGMRSATVIGPDAVMTDALSTSVFILGVDAGMRLIAGLPGYEAVAIDGAGAVYFSDGLAPP